MASPNNNLSVLPWYTSLDKQNAKKWYAFGNVWPLVMPTNRIIPYQFVVPFTNVAITGSSIISLDTKDIYDGQSSHTLVTRVDYTVVKSNGFTVSLPEGRYYAKIDFANGVTYYSEVFTLVSNISDYVKIQYWNDDILVYNGGEINYEDEFKFEMYLCTTIGKPEYSFEEEVTKRLGYKFPELQVSNKLYKFTCIGPEYLCDAMRLIRLSDYIKIVSKDDSYNALTFSYDAKWETQGDLASIEVEFETDTIIQKLSSFNRGQREGFYNALLVDINEALLFDENTVALYYDEYRSSTRSVDVEGKLIRELELITEVGENSQIVVDTGQGPAVRMNLYELIKNFIKRDSNEIIEGLWTFKKGLKTGNDKDGEPTGEITENGYLKYIALIVKEFISSEKFVSGLLGEGFKIYEKNCTWYIECDNLTVRQVLTVFEMIISKLRAVNGGLVVSPGNNTIKSVSETDTQYVLEVEDDIEIAKDDFIRHQVFSTSHTKNYWVKVINVAEGKIYTNKSEYNGTVPAKGDEIITMGNATNSKRQGLIYITAAEDGRPRIEILEGVKDKTLAATNRTVLGNLDDIQDSAFEEGYQPSGSGLYCDNAFLRGIFILRSGKNVETEIDAADKKIESVKTELSAVDGKITLAVKTAKEEAISASKTYTNSEIKVVKDQIALKVDSTTFDALNKKVTEQGSQITLNKNNIEQKVNKSDFNALGTRVSNAETKITQNANEIQQRATKSTVDALTGRVTTAESKITQNANSISLKITASEATNIANNAVNNLQIGGTNLLVNTDFLHNRDYWTGGDVDSSVTLQGRNSLRMITSGLTSDSWRGGEQNNTPYLSAKQGDTFTISLFSRTDNVSSFDRGANMEIRYFNSSGGRITQSGFNIRPSTNNTWTRFVGTGTCPAGTVKVSAVWYNTRNGRIWVNGIKLEVGKKATDWTRSPHDSPTTQDVKSSFTIDTGGISMLGKKLSLTGMVTFNSLASDAQGKINTAQSTANTAKSAAETAKSTADGANSKATTAQNTANTAKSTADSANSKATTAQNTANTAKSTADAAKTAAANAQSRADAAYNKKIELAQLGTTVISGGFIKTSLIKADEIIVSKLSGATGTFKQLQAVGSDGSVKGTLRLDGDRLWYDGDQYQQGTKDGRPLRYYLSDAWVRGNFGARTRTTLLVQGSSGYFYPKGADKAGVYKSFERGTASNGRTYYKLPCYGLDGDYSGMPVDLIVFNVTSSNQHFYELQLAVTQKVNMINCNNNYTNVLIYCNGNYPGLPGGSVHYAWNVLPFMNPQPTANVLGRGLLFGGSNDNDWK